MHFLLFVLSRLTRRVKAWIQSSGMCPFCVYLEVFSWAWGSMRFPISSSHILNVPFDRSASNGILYLWIGSKASQDDVQLANEIATEMTKVHFLPIFSPRQVKLDLNAADIFWLFPPFFFVFRITIRCRLSMRARSQISFSGMPWAERRHTKRCVDHIFSHYSRLF